MSINPDLLARVNRTWADQFQLPSERIAQPGTTLYIRRTGSLQTALTLWPVGDHVVLEASAAQEAQMRAILARFPADHRLTLDDLRSVWGAVRSEDEPLYALDADEFRPFPVPAPYTVRQLSPDDQPAFDTFLGRIPQAEKDEGDVALDHMIAFGIFDGTRIIAASSVFVWRGFIDIGILTDPAYRGQGLGKAGVSVCAAYYLPGERIVGYRHGAQNLASRGIGRALGFSYYATATDIVLPAK